MQFIELIQELKGNKQKCVDTKNSSKKIKCTLKDTCLE